MNDQLLERCDLLVKNRAAIQRSFLLEKELMAVADAGMLMPPKSTWFEPKLRSGLFIHVIER